MLRIGSRGSKLALWQAQWVRSALERQGEHSEIEIIRTTGDNITDVSLARLGASTGVKGLFTKEIEEALLCGRIDLAVHSLKDMPVDLPGGLVLAAVPEREDARDVLVGSTLARLPQNAKIGTSSLRRAAQLRACRPDLVIEPLRGNIDTRLRKLDEGQYAGIVLAAAGLKRMGWEGRIAELLPPEVMCPAVGQGALAIETRSDEGNARQACRKLDHAQTRAAVTAERALLRLLGGGCQVPIGGHAVVEDGRVHLRAVVISPDGRQIVRRENSGAVAEAEHVGAELARDILDAGARAILEVVYGTSGL
ncbi:MAG: hydroxymethylbilane synthase [Bryobacteraceae bacterium]|nr:hydroxymethylbilane synthase [Bryobacterales bacterium]MEB2363196.1 hydroxymethylbilane synthase [Bryobacterales bacterium]NUN03233.1 hydroxymethylbilane synthase [Bryobacteraceae bacterium]